MKTTEEVFLFVRKFLWLSINKTDIHIINILLITYSWYVYDSEFKAANWRLQVKNEKACHTNAVKKHKDDDLYYNWIFFH